mgnify:CR=1 FL=1
MSRLENLDFQVRYDHFEDERTQTWFDRDTNVRRKFIDGFTQLTNVGSEANVKEGDDGSVKPFFHYFKNLFQHKRIRKFPSHTIFGLLSVNRPYIIEGRGRNLKYV